MKVTETALEELEELCDEVMDLDDSKTDLVLRIRANAADDKFSEAECRQYIEYLKEVVFNSVNRR